MSAGRIVAADDQLQQRCTGQRDHQDDADDEDQDRCRDRGLRARVDPPHQGVRREALVARHREDLPRARGHHHHPGAEHRERDARQQDSFGDRSELTADDRGDRRAAGADRRECP